MPDFSLNALDLGASRHGSWLRSLPRLLFGPLVARLPLDFRVLYKQFLLRIFDLEALSIEADSMQFLGQLAGILILLSPVPALSVIFGLAANGLLIAPAPELLEKIGLHHEQGMLARMFLVAGILEVFTWDAIFPDRRDVLVLGPLPLRPWKILAAKVSAAAAVLGLALVSLNLISVLSLPPLVAGSGSGPRMTFAWCLAVAGCAVFVFATVLAIQGGMALLLPRRIFLRLSSLMQLAGFILFPAAFFLLPEFESMAALADPANRALVGLWPQYWFLALLRQVAGQLPPNLEWLAARAWLALGLCLLVAAATLVAAYRRTLRSIVEQPDLEPTGARFHWTLPLGNRLETALVLFSLRTLQRSRQHRVALVTGWSLVMAIALAMVRQWITTPGSLPVDNSFLIPTILMMALALVALRGVFSLPVALRANWVLRVTQMRSTEAYLAGTRRVLVLFGVLPVWSFAALYSIHCRPWTQAGMHLFVLALFGLVTAEFTLLGFSKVPFTCSYMPGKTNFQFVFWGLMLVFLMLSLLAGLVEQPLLNDPGRFAILLAVLAGIGAVLWLVNRHAAQTAVLYFEEPPEETITQLKLTIAPGSAIQGQ